MPSRHDTALLFIARDRASTSSILHTLSTKYTVPLFRCIWISFSSEFNERVPSTRRYFKNSLLPWKAMGRVKRASMPQPTQCLGCGKVFKNLRRHQQRWQCRGQDLWYACEDPECTNTYLSRDAARNHYREKHVDQRPPSMSQKQCKYPGCGKILKSSRNLKVHVQSQHYGQRFQCDAPGCGKMFSTKSHCTSHYQSEHLGRPKRSCYPRPAPCDYPGCGRVFSGKQQQRLHYQRAHLSIQSALLQQPRRGIQGLEQEYHRGAEEAQVELFLYGLGV